MFFLVYWIFCLKCCIYFKEWSWKVVQVLSWAIPDVLRASPIKVMLWFGFVKSECWKPPQFLNLLAVVILKVWVCFSTNAAPRFLNPFSSKSDQHQFSLNSTSILKCVEIVQQSFLCVLTFYQYHSVVFCLGYSVHFRHECVRFIVIFFFPVIVS